MVYTTFLVIQHISSLEQRDDLVSEHVETTNVAKNVSFSAEFSTYLRYTRQLDFFETPDYNYMRGLFTGLMAANGWQCDWDFDWSSRHTVCTRISLHHTEQYSTARHV